MNWLLIGVIFTLAHTNQHRSTFDRIISTNGLTVDASPIPPNGNEIYIFYEWFHSAYKTNINKTKHRTAKTVQLTTVTVNSTHSKAKPKKKHTQQKAQ